ncbi:PEP-CTERM sorting domain-containing protein [Aetokthonos hydrillicola Thurmond2011]|jgi:hypothetical protein|uniref:PEP-CTERM sorting domain-containing protein n=1 Tax=Aetokthonos hydrillicola Thurmond2011 TaxID=2712845 RepID=A0AAP5I9G4_9CYAN|nr:PEP-CTERM sorting domain-containing protein [Aetokthonos hydrillicola]MBO3461438.1 PEP-CTERM sorting domain-containing protein [Aetokthonos hydrillicola CCALA 1050]MBW4588780.1 PEP-CTERM sorting domain-containing protein [Aetokthonos hydrillicola CCALA 1050]MDR9897356.1 PEP-CTERM sorting domain-containing protein [Aetokthonos hydrillicola Thurmond2011]
MLKTKSSQKLLVVIFGLALAAFATAKPSRASVLTYQGDTTNQAIWRRVAPGNPPTLLSGEKDGNLGMSVPYSVFDFTVTQSGSYTISGVSEATPPQNTPWDIFLALYQDSFNPAQQLTNVLIADTTNNAETVTFNQPLTAGRDYFLVTTGRRVSDFGVFTNTISGAGRIVPVPESDSIPAMLVAVGLLVTVGNKRRVLK